MREGVPTLGGYLASHGYDTAGFAANLDYCSRETGLARGFAHYEDFPFSIADTFARYIALGRRIEASSWESALDSLVEKQTGRWLDLIPRSREHAKSGCDRSCIPGMAGKASQEGASVLRVPQLQRRS